MRMKQVKDIADMIADIYKVGPLTYPKVFQCDNVQSRGDHVAGEAWCDDMMHNNEVPAHSHGVH